MTETQTTMHRIDFTDEVNQQLTDFYNETGLTGASLHAASVAHDTGDQFLVTGHQVSRQARSALGAWATLRALHGAERIWHIDPSGKRALVYRRYI